MADSLVIIRGDRTNVNHDTALVVVHSEGRNGWYLVSGSAS